MHKRGSVELWIFLVIVVIAFGGAFYVLLPQNNAEGMFSLRSTWGAAYVPPMPSPGEMQYGLLQCQSTCHGTPIEKPRHEWDLERRGGDFLKQCLAWCRNKWRVAGAQLVPGKYDIDYLRVQQNSIASGGPELTYPRELEKEGIPKVSREDLPPGVFRQQYI